jgi:hypothetical protein
MASRFTQGGIRS